MRYPTEFLKVSSKEADASLTTIWRDKAEGRLHSCFLVEDSALLVDDPDSHFF